MRLRFRPGVHTDAAFLSAADDLRWRKSDNVRWRRLSSTRMAMETIGPTISVVDTAENPLLAVNDVWTLFPYNSADGETRTICAELNRLAVLRHAPGSTNALPLRVLTEMQTVAPVSLIAPALPDVTPIQPFWWFVEQDDLIVGGRAGEAAAPLAWNKDIAFDFTAISGAPLNAVGGAIVDRILVLLGARSIAHPDPGPGLTIRWSNAFDFAEWTPADLNVSGELQLEGGSRIMGGGLTRFGIVAWTDKNMAILRSNPRIDIVFEREYVDGATGLCGNRTWCETNGRLWWLDGQRQLKVYDGGAVRDIPCPLADVTLTARADALESSYFLLTANPTYEEIWISYRVDMVGMSRTVVYNYALDVWYPLSHFDTIGGYFTHFASPLGAQPLISAARIQGVGAAFSFHDVSSKTDPLYELYAGDTTGVSGDLYRPFRFSLTSAPFTVDDETASRTISIHDLLIDARVSPPPGVPLTDVSATFDVTATGYRDGQPSESMAFSEIQRWRSSLTSFNFRVDGRALEIGMATRDGATWDDTRTWNDADLWNEDETRALARFRFGEIWADIRSVGAR